MKQCYHETRKYRGGTYSFYANRTKLCNGMAKTASNQKIADDKLPLIVRGTFDKLALILTIWKPSICECCGERSRNKRQLSDRGKTLLNYLRNKEKYMDVIKTRLGI